MEKLLLIKSPVLRYRGARIVRHLNSLGQGAVKIVEYDAAAPGPSVSDEIVVLVLAQKPSIVIFTATGYRRAAEAVREATGAWEKKPHLILISGDALDLVAISRQKGFTVIADDSDGHRKGYVNLSDGGAVLKALRLYPPSQEEVS